MSTKTNWVDGRLNSVEIADIKDINISELLSGKNIFISPEGTGKSTHILKEAATHRLTSNDKTQIIYSAHTIENAIEKYNIARKFPDVTIREEAIRFSYKAPIKNHIYLIESDSELFRRMLKAQNEDLYKFFRRHLHNNEKYMKFEIYSYTKGGEFRRLGNTQSYKDKIKAQLKINPSSESYNSVVMQILYNILNSAGKNHYYHIAFKFVDLIEELYGDIVKSKNIPEIVYKNRFYQVAIQKELHNYDVDYICITPESIKNWNGFKIGRDKQIKKALADKFSIIITQNKVTENLLIPKMKKGNIPYTVIYDEITPDCFKCMTLKDQEKILAILKKITKYGKDSLSIEDEIFLEDFNIKKDAINLGTKKSRIMEISNTQFKLLANTPHATVGKPYLNNRYSQPDNILILTSEKLIPSILVKGFGFKAVEWKKGFRVWDNDIHLYATTKKCDLPITHKNKDKVSEFIKDLKDAECHKKILSIGTSYFQPDMTIESCKGRNFDTVYDKIIIVKNPEPLDKYTLFLDVMQQYEDIEITEVVRKNVLYYATVDMMNQTLGRVAGYRRPKFEKTIVEIYYYSQGNCLRSVLLDSCRYLGRERSFEERWDEVRFEKQQYEAYFKALNEKLSLYTDKYYFGHSSEKTPNPWATLNEMLRREKVGKKALIEQKIPLTIINTRAKIMREIPDSFGVEVENYFEDKIKVINDNIRTKNYHLLKFDPQEYPNIYYMYVANFWKAYYGENSVFYKQLEGNEEHLLIHANSNINIYKAFSKVNDSTEARRKFKSDPFVEYKKYLPNMRRAFIDEAFGVNIVDLHVPHTKRLLDKIDVKSVKKLWDDVMMGDAHYEIVGPNFIFFNDFSTNLPLSADAARASSAIKAAEWSHDKLERYIHMHSHPS